MTASIVIVFVSLGLAALLFVTEWLSVDLVAVLVMLALAIVGVIEHKDALAGFSNPAVITVASVLVLGAGLLRTGVADIVGRRVLRLAGTSQARLLVVTMVTVGVLSGFMNNIGVAALFLPVLLDIARRLEQPPSKLLMPLAFGTLLGGLTTLIGTAPNVLISGALEEAGFEPFGLLDFTPIGLCAIGLGTTYMVLVGRRLLPVRDLARTNGPPERDLETAYGLMKRLGALSIPADSPLVGRTLAQSRLGAALGLNVVAIQRDGQTSPAPDAGTTLRTGDRLLVEGRTDQLRLFQRWRELVLEGERWTEERFAALDIELAELRVHERSPLHLATLTGVGFRHRCGVSALALARGAEVHLTHLADRELRAGDRLLVQGSAATLDRLCAADELGVTLRVPAAEAASFYGLHRRLTTVRVTEGSVLAGRSLAESGMGSAFDVTVLGVLDATHSGLSSEPEEGFRPGDTLLVLGRPEDLMIVGGLKALHVDEEGPPDIHEIESAEVRLMEVMLAPDSRLKGKRLSEMHFRERFGLNVVAIWSEGHAYRSNLRERPVGFGDVLLVHGRQEKLALLHREPDLLPLAPAAPGEQTDARRAPLGAGIMLGVLLAVLSGSLPIYVAAPLGAAVMVLTGCLTMEDAYRSIEWKAVILIAGMLSLGVAMEKTGAAQLLADLVLGNAAQLGPFAVLAALFWVAALAAQVMPTAAVAVLIAPVALDAAPELGMNPRALLMVVAVASSSAFMSPVGHPVNLMVMGLGGYRFIDYVRVGFPLVLINFLIAMLVVPLLFPLAA